MRLSFTIRDLLWLTAVVAIVGAWWHDRARYAREATDAKLHAESTVKAMFLQMNQDKAIENLLEGTNESLRRAHVDDFRIAVWMQDLESAIKSIKITSTNTIPAVPP
jgi:mRNA-degrading endonuclease RelE of RelBE toxin-antitoxin system